MILNTALDKMIRSAEGKLSSAELTGGSLEAWPGRFAKIHAKSRRGKS
jgi:hypothetical protein